MFSSTRSRSLPRRRNRAFHPVLESLEDRTVPSIGAPITISTSGIDEDNPATARAANGCSVVVWELHSNAGGQDVSLRAQVCNSKGLPVGGPIAIANTSDYEFLPDVSMDAKGNFAVAWSQYHSGSWDVHYALYNKVGGLMRQGSMGTPALDELGATVAMNATGKFVVAYITMDDWWSGETSDVYVQRFDAAANPLGGPIPVSTHSNRLQGPVHVARADGGRFAVAYLSSTHGSTTYDVNLSQYNASGTLLSQTWVATVSGTAVPPFDVGMDNAGNCVVVAETATSASNHDVLMMRVAATGILKPLVYVASSADYEGNPSIAVDRTDGTLVVAYDHRSSSGTQTVAIGTFARNGVLKARYSLESASEHADVSIDALDRYFVAYRREFSSSDRDIYARLGKL